MVDYGELKRKFKVRKPAAGVNASPMHRKSDKAAVKAIAREYELKKAELQGSGAPVFRRGPLFYGVLTLLLLTAGGLVLTASKKGVGFGRERMERKPLQARKSMDALAVALGRYRFHTGEYPSTGEGLAALAAKSWRKKGWDGPYINHVVDDPWGHEYVYETRPEGGHPVLYSRGPDGRAGTTDDVLPDQRSFEEPFRDTSWTNGWAPYRLRGVVVAPDAETKRRVEEEMKKYD
ncbi:MAG: type II secretion system protein GspG [Kiritimatiellae bacterium]|nr:type II secretion system protein GspG [Kiritimatiellia bacterium]